LVISLNRTDKGLERKSLKTLISGDGITKLFPKYPLAFLSFSILLSLSDGETVGKEGKRASAGNWSDNAGRLWTMEAMSLFRLLAVTSGDSGRLNGTRFKPLATQLFKL